jgi:sugar transferase (PEP-CTERM/EpsH1 system associated)
MTSTASSAHAVDARPLVAHVLYRFSVGGLENGVVTLVNRLPHDRFRHAIISLTDISDFRSRVQRDDAIFVALHKRPGQTAALFPRMVRVFRQLRPDIVHTRNLAALECQVPAWLAGVSLRVHGEHGWDVSDPGGTNRRYRWVRRAYRPWVKRYIALSQDLQRYLCEQVGVPPGRVTQVYNGVDAGRFRPAAGGRSKPAGSPFGDPSLWVIGTVGRMQAVKDHEGLARAFVLAVERSAEARRRLRLVVIGDGAHRAKVEAILADAGVGHLAWLPGERADVPDLMRALDCFVQPSLAEGISNTVLEAMACGLPVVATAVGGNPELVEDGASGLLVPVADARALADALLVYFNDPAQARRHGTAGRVRAEARFSLDAMVGAYAAVYDDLLGRRRVGSA